MERVIGYSPDGVRRVFAPTLFEAQCEARDYIARRPDTGPLASWHFEIEGK